MTQISNESVAPQVVDVPLPEVAGDLGLSDESNHAKQAEAPATPDLSKLSEEEYTLLYFQQHLQRFVDKVNNYQGARGQLQQVLVSIAVAGLNEEAPEFSYPEQYEVYDMFAELESAKLMLMLYGMKAKGLVEIKQELLDNIRKPVVNSENQTETKEEGTN